MIYWHITLGTMDAAYLFHIQNEILSENYGLIQMSPTYDSGRKIGGS